MKLVKEHINEKFSEDSDPIRDMGIGIKHKLKKYALDTLPISLTENELRKIKDFFGISLRDIYWLGDSEINYGMHEYFDKINKIISHENKQLLFNSDWILRHTPGSCFRGFNTSIGKIATLENKKGYSGAYISITYFGNIEAAIALDLHNSKIYDDL